MEALERSQAKTADTLDSLSLPLLEVFIEKKIASDKMVRSHHVEGFDECIALLNTFSGETKVVLYFCGNVDENGENWCPDCQLAEPVVSEVIEENKEKNFEFVHVAVGSRDEWKDPQCKFRTDSRFKLTSVPTLMIYKAVERLNDVECQDKENIRALLEDLPC